MKMVLGGSDTNPGDYYMYDRTKNSLAYLGSSRPWIDPTKDNGANETIFIEAKGWRNHLWILDCSSR